MLILTTVYYRGYRLEIHHPHWGNPWLGVTDPQGNAHRWEVPAYWCPRLYAKWRVDQALDNASVKP